MKINWSLVYSSLQDAGYDTSLIADTAGVSRTLVSQMISGTYAHMATHEPKFSGGCALLNALRDAVRDGDLPQSIMADIRGTAPEDQKEP